MVDSAAADAVVFGEAHKIQSYAARSTAVSRIHFRLQMSGEARFVADNNGGIVDRRRASPYLLPRPAKRARRTVPVAADNWHLLRSHMDRFPCINARENMDDDALFARLPLDLQAAISGLAHA